MRPLSSGTENGSEWPRRSVLRLGLAGGLGCLFGLVGARCGAPDPAAIERRARAIGERHGLRIGYGMPRTFFVDPYTVADAVPEGWSVSPAQLDDVPGALDGIEQALSSYPDAFVAQMCKAIFFCGELLLDGTSVAASYGPAWVVISAAQDGVRREPRFIRSNFHHEFASFIWNSSPTLQSVWDWYLPRGWHQISNVRDAVAAPNEGTERVEEGFMTPYGATTASNDFSTYAEVAFLDPERLAELAGRIPVVASKAALLLAAYTEVDARMAAVFAGLGLGQLADPHAFEVKVRSQSTPVIPEGKVVR